MDTHRLKPRWFLQVLPNLLLAVILMFGACLTARFTPALAGSGVLAGWRMQSWTASSGTAGNPGTALLSTNTTNPFPTSTGAPPGEMNVFISHDWENGNGTKYWKVHFISTGFENLTVSSQQMSSDLGFGTWNGPRDFKLQYSLDNSTWTDVPAGSLTLGSDWIESGRLTNLSLPSALNNQPDAYLRWIMTSNTSVSPSCPTTDSAAQSMIGGIYIYGDEIPVAPTDILLSNNTLATSDPPGALVGTLSAVDTNQYDTWTYTLVSGAGDTDNASFIIGGDLLSTTVSLAPGAYSIRVNVNDGTYDFAKALAINVTAYPPITGGNTSWGDYMTHVTFAGIDHASGDDDGYADYTAYAATVDPGSSHALTATIMLGEGETYSGTVVAWIDWNQNYSFDDAGEKYVVGTNLNVTGVNTASVTINVPTTATVGATRMRVVMDAKDGVTEPPNADSGVFYGDAEDYSVTVSGSTATCTASSNSDWSNPAIWSCGHVPTASDDVVIPTGVTVILDVDIDLGGNLDVQGTLDPNGKTVTLTGDQAQELSGNLTFHNLTINKTNATDTVTVTSGKLTSSGRTRIRKGKLITASDYEDLEIDTDGTLQLGNDITIGGNLVVTGTLDTNGYGITFDGGKEQNLTLVGVTTFDDLTVTAGATLIETVSGDHALVNGTLTNNGVIRKTQAIDGITDYYFGLASQDELLIDVTMDNFTSITVERRDQNHPGRTGTGGLPAAGVGWGIYWTITPDGSGAADLILPHDLADDTLAQACRFVSGTTWDCARDDSDEWTVTRYGVTEFSDWAVGNKVTPTAVNVRGLAARGGLWGMSAVSVLAVGLVLARRRKRA